MKKLVIVFTVILLAILVTVLIFLRPINYFSNSGYLEIFEVRTRCNLTQETERCVNNEVEFTQFLEDELLNLLQNYNARRRLVFTRHYPFVPRNDAILVDFLTDDNSGVGTIIFDLETPHVRIQMPQNASTWWIVYYLINPEGFIEDLFGLE